MKTDSRRTAGHLPVKISRATKFLVDRGAEVIVKYISPCPKWIRDSLLTSSKDE